jgi:hypothetical protein
MTLGNLGLNCPIPYSEPYYKRTHCSTCWQCQPDKLSNQSDAMAWLHDKPKKCYQTLCAEHCSTTSAQQQE